MEGEESTTSQVVLERGIVVSTSLIAQDWGTCALLGGGGGEMGMRGRSKINFGGTKRRRVRWKVKIIILRH